MPEIVEYSALLTFSPLSTSDLEAVRDAASHVNLDERDVGATYVEFEYSGRDHNRKIVQFLAFVASLVGSAEGEVECVVDNDDGDPTFQFFRIRDGGLYVQDASLVRGEVRKVTNAEQLPYD